MPREKTTRIRRSFTPEFKRDAMRLVKQGKSVTEVARDLGIARSLLQYWMREQRGEREKTSSPREKLPSDAERIRQLEKELRDAREERDILKKALAYFADDQK
jgi:transposase